MVLGELLPFWRSCTTGTFYRWASPVALTAVAVGTYAEHYGAKSGPPTTWQFAWDAFVAVVVVLVWGSAIGLDRRPSPGGRWAGRPVARRPQAVRRSLSRRRASAGRLSSVSCKP